MTIQQQIKLTISKYHLLRKGDRILIGVSGGPDSMALLYLLYDLRYDLGVNLSVAHLNHNLRNDALKDEELVRSTCKQLKISFYSKTLIKSDLKNKGSLEEAAREHRYAFLMETAQKQKIQTIAIGHTRDDLAETVLMKLLRGSGVMGLRGILPLRVIKNFRIIRPILECTRKEVLEYLKQKKISFIMDPTNRQEVYFRNKIRLKLLPELEKNYSPNIKELLANFASILTDDYEFMESQAREALKKIQKKSDQQILLDLNKLSKLPKAIQRMILRLSVEELKGNLNKLSFHHFEEIGDLLKNRPERSVVHLPYNITVQKISKSLVISLRKA